VADRSGIVAGCPSESRTTAGSPNPGVGQGAEPAVRVRRERSVWGRMRGLLGRPPPAPGAGLWLSPCRQVHTVGMRYPIDVVHLDREGRVLLIETLVPWRVGRFVWAGHSVVELAAENPAAGDRGG